VKVQTLSLFAKEFFFETILKKGNNLKMFETE